ncbi:MAG TPA: hypothetical protein VN704_04880 [Verrucomicrobiae bacterium]|nr:hypothetical protein [Verrucomicrobiae bacterium]
MSTNVTDMEALSNGLDAILAIYETTDSIDYLEDAITLVKNNISKAQQIDLIPGNKLRFNDSYKGWIDRGKDTSTSYYHTEVVLSEIYFYQYVARLLKDINNDRKVKRIDKIKQFYTSTLSFIEKNIWDKWVNRGIRLKNNPYSYLLLGRTHMASHWAYIASELYFLTKNEKRKKDYLAFVNLYNNDLENNFSKYDKYILWNQTWDSITSGPGIIQDVSHANLVISYIVEAYDLGLWKDFDAIQRIINTIKDKLWDSQDCFFKDNIDGTMFQAGKSHSSVGSFQADGFIKLTRYDKSLFSIYEKVISCSKYLTAWYQYGQLFSNLALSEKLLR